jgi:hypothetical protein
METLFVDQLLISTAIAGALLDGIAVDTYQPTALKEELREFAGGARSSWR